MQNTSCLASAHPSTQILQNWLCQEWCWGWSKNLIKCNCEWRIEEQIIHHGRSWLHSLGASHHPQFPTKDRPHTQYRFVTINQWDTLQENLRQSHNLSRLMSRMSTEGVQLDVSLGMDLQEKRLSTDNARHKPKAEGRGKRVPRSHLVAGESWCARSALQTVFPSLLLPIAMHPDWQLCQSTLCSLLV
jgi:hypothetical protein